MSEPRIGQVVNGEWVVYIPKMKVDCVRLRRFNPHTGANEYKDIPLSEW